MGIRENELRVGNWVQFRHTETPVRITLGDFVREYNDEHLEDYEPIPLTEEWLLKFGFENKGHGFSDNIYYKQEELLNWGHRVIMSNTGIVLQHGFMNQWSELTSVEYVHQLQNLFHALTGEELTIKTIDHK